MSALTGKRIFIVEDNSHNRIVYQLSLGMEGAFISFDRWGHEAIDKLKKSHQWDLIILDLMLKAGTSGFDIFEQIRQMSQFNHVPVVAISASEPAIAIPKAQTMGFDGFISKPIDEEIFVDQIVRILNGEKIWHDGTLAR